METKKTEKQVKLSNTGKIDLPKFDPKPFIGKKVEIVSVKEFEGNFGYYVKVTSDTVTTIQTKEGEKEVTASVLLGLQTDSEGNIGWGEGTKTDAFLKKMKVKHYNDLLGKVVTIQTRTDKDGNEFLTF